MDKIYPCLWFDDRAEEAAKFYASIFPRSKVTRVARHGASTSEASGRPKASVMFVEMDLDGQTVLLLNGGPVFHFSEAISFVVPCKDQGEIDTVWAALTKGGGEEGQCGWCKDKYGLSWQVVPKRLAQMATDPDAAKVERAMAALLAMTKLDLATLERAYAG